MRSAREATQYRGLAAFAALLVVALATLAGANLAKAAVKQAETVLPPGQSGFVSLTGLPDGTGSPHLSDQVELFKAFKYKSAVFGQAGETETPRAGVRIVRGPYGVPSVTGSTDFDAWWGVGYAVAQDRLFQLELFRRATSGRLAEILGDGFLADDLIARRDYYTDPELDQMLSRLPANLVRRAEAYRDGINAWVEQTRRDPSKLPGEFTALGCAAAHLDCSRHRPDRRLPRPHRALGRRGGAGQPARAPRAGCPRVRQAAPPPGAGADLHRPAQGRPVPLPAGPHGEAGATRLPALAQGAEDHAHPHPCRGSRREQLGGHRRAPTCGA